MNSRGIIYERFGYIKAQNNKRQSFIQKVFSASESQMSIVLLLSERLGLELRNWVEDSEQPFPIIRNNSKQDFLTVAFMRDSGLGEKIITFTYSWPFFEEESNFMEGMLRPSIWKDSVVCWGCLPSQVLSQIRSSLGKYVFPFLTSPVAYCGAAQREEHRKPKQASFWEGAPHIHSVRYRMDSGLVIGDC